MPSNLPETVFLHPFTETESDPALPPEADVVIIGGGIIGITAALELAQHGLKVAVLEKGKIAAEQSSRNWGWVRQQGRDRRELPLIVQSLALWEHYQQSLGTDLGFRRTGLVSLTRDEKELKRWQRWATRGRAADITVEELNTEQAERFLRAGSRPWLGGISTPTDAKAEPGLAVPALAKAARQASPCINILRHAPYSLATEKLPVSSPNMALSALAQCYSQRGLGRLYFFANMTSGCHSLMFAQP
ncbi:FAD-dependent oxidoreductase [Paludibacterium sp. dN 18-1]|uniref:FAD-dependent oxidoreductase n=1 Tax=Paludibacterium denitrificans TaxID=2675226 RepID=A0A844GER8_9NEIS|nr:FAD-dependent oxidoreductase [Paludibacterium denitrificans]MTD34159.1 FAD-dependent oxidoreductase [Paludibacterium denitrificans]